jgi:SpoVK/Ycf46/Vps4 family AAA+-type ATPase
MASLSNDENSGTAVNPKNASMWAVAGDCYMPCERTESSLPPGQYTVELSQDRGLYFKRTNVILDGLVPLPDDESERIIKHIQDFWDRKDVYKKMEVLHKRGVLLWGPPGSGKTTTVQQLSQQIIQAGGISIYVKDPERTAIGLDYLRKIEPNRPVVVMLEDIDTLASGRHDSESNLLALLDGELQIDNVVFVATTNYPERLDKRLVNRPSRFDVVQKIDMPNAEARRAFLKFKYPDLCDLPYPNDDNEARKVEITERISVIDVKVGEVTGDIATLRSEISDLEGQENSDVAIERNRTKLTSLEAKLDEFNHELKELDTELNQVDDNKVLLDYWVERTEKFSIAHLKELVISVFVYDMSFDSAHKRLDTMAKSAITSTSAGLTNL